MLLSDPRWKEGDQEARLLMVIYRDRVDRVAEMQPRTAEGLRAKAALAERDIDNAGEENSLVASLLDNLQGRAG